MNPSLATRMNAFGILGICAVLLGAYYVQFAMGELACPLCLLQRLAMLGVAFGAMLNLRFGIRTSHYAVSLISAVFGASVSLRQILLHLDPSDIGYGSTVFGMHLYTWAFIVFAVVIILIGVMMFFEGQFESKENDKSIASLSLFVKAVFLLVVLITVANVVTTFLECGISECPSDPTSYKELASMF